MRSFRWYRLYARTIPTKTISCSCAPQLRTTATEITENSPLLVVWPQPTVIARYVLLPISNYATSGRCFLSAVQPLPQWYLLIFSIVIPSHTPRATPSPDTPILLNHGGQFHIRITTNLTSRYARSLTTLMESRVLYFVVFADHYAWQPATTVAPYIYWHVPYLSCGCLMAAGMRDLKKAGICA